MNSIKVATINVLSDLSAWDERKEPLALGLAREEPHLVALQEVCIQEKVAGWLADRLNIPYVHLTPKSGEDKEREGIAILSRIPFQKALVLDLQIQNRVAQAVQIQTGETSLLFANAHLLWQPGSSDARLEQVSRLIRWLEGNLGDSSLVLCGDFNAYPENPSIQRIYQNYRSAYKEIHGKEPERTMPTPLKRSRLSLVRSLLPFLPYLRLRALQVKKHGTLDYIFLSQNVDVLDCRLILKDPAPGKPNIYPSDHYGLVAELSLKN